MTIAAENLLFGNAAPGLRGVEYQALRSRFPARVVPDTWPATAESRVSVAGRVGDSPWPEDKRGMRRLRQRGVEAILLWLESFPGDTWQERWRASPAHDLGPKWTDALTLWLDEQGRPLRRGVIQCGLLYLLCSDVLRPNLDWLVNAFSSQHWRNAVATHRDPQGFALMEEQAGVAAWGSRLGLSARGQFTVLMLAKGGRIRDITLGDCLELRDVEAAAKSPRTGSRTLFYTLLKDAGLLPEDAPHTLRDLKKYTGQLSVGQLVDRYSLQCQPVRDLIVDYLTERQPALDYNTLEGHSRTIARNFWKNLEIIHPGIESLHLSPAMAAAWKERIRNKTTRRKNSAGEYVEVISPRSNYVDLLTGVRGFYLDIAQWALEDPGRWGPWAAPCPITEAEISQKKKVSHRKARMDQRTRERLPMLPILVRAAEQRLKDAQARLEALIYTKSGESFSILGETFTRSSARSGRVGPGCAFDAEGRRRNLTQEEHRAFWGWAATEILRHTGIRIEELRELSHHSLTQYRLPDTGELIPLLQVAPSKTDEERLLVVGPELADVLSVIVTRVRNADGSIPLVPSYDPAERIWNSPMPLLFQWFTGGQRRSISESTIRTAISEILLGSGLTDAGGQPLTYQPHDFRRIFTTEAIQNGMPPHIAQLLLGHKDINTTMGYKAIYPEEAIHGHRAFIARRRSLRPALEYRTPTDEEWDEFLGHFERRKVALGDCGRAYGTDCQYEHSCVRCPLLRVDPSEQRRLEEIRDNLSIRISEAEERGWLGEAEQLKVSLAAAEDKLTQLDARNRRTTVNLGIPTFHQVAGRTAAHVPKPTSAPLRKTCRGRIDLV